MNVSKGVRANKQQSEPCNELCLVFEIQRYESHLTYVRTLTSEKNNKNVSNTVAQGPQQVSSHYVIAVAKSNTVSNLNPRQFSLPSPKAGTQGCLHLAMSNRQSRG
ncbi:hypothetical protein E2C01_021171 [Portunus trituberculatus]|uniref:Uncharacterized protein n=1 Tax=Portunus trituberculatus TaxID=210409 RepID=A0A5B7E2J1_PORTR|nr:hypothetical protein [Portunus trituberculatus]